jgi:thioredoxin 2
MHSAASQADAASSGNAKSDNTSPGKVVIACPHCHTLVRVPQERLGDNPACAKCKSDVITGHPVALDTQSFETHTTRGDLPVLVDFWAEWCGPCRAMAPVLDRFADQHRTRLQVGKVNTDENQQLSGRLGIRSIPTLILFRGGKEVARRSGSSDLTSLNRWVDQALS